MALPKGNRACCIRAWTKRIAALRAEEIRRTQESHDALAKRLTSPCLTHYEILDAVSAAVPEDAVIVTDVGQHQMWTAQRYPLRYPRTFLTSGGLGTMGFGLGAAVGAQIATGKRTVLITGDGSFGMNLTELATAVSEHADITVIIMNNGVLGMVRQWQTLFFDRRHAGTTLNRKTDFAAVAAGFGAGAARAASLTELRQALAAANAQKGPFVIDCVTDADEFVLPMLPPGGSVDDIITTIK